MVDDAGPVADEADVLRASKQYDIELVYHCDLSRCNFVGFAPNVWARCHSLTVVNLSRNQLRSLAGIEAIGTTLTFLNAAENKILSVAPLASCSKLKHCYLEGNGLSTLSDVSALVSLPELQDVVLSRSIPLDDNTLLELDNPICRNVDVYHQLCCSDLAKVRWVDGISSYRRCHSADGRGTNEVSASSLLYEELTEKTMQRLKDAMSAALAPLEMEQELKNELSKAKSKCAEVLKS